MSHCLILQQYDDFYIGADSAGSIKINDSFYRTSNNMQKIFTLGTDIYFCSGIDRYVDACNKYINEHFINTIDVVYLRNFLKNTFVARNLNSKELVCFDVEILLCRIEDGISKVYHFAQYNNFDIVVYEGRKDQINIVCGGCKTQDGFNTTKNTIACGNVKLIYTTVFRNLLDERIGGYLSVYHKNDLFYQIQLDEVQIDTHLVLSDAVVSGFISGSVIEGGSLRIGGQEGDKGTFIVNNDGSVQILGPEGNAKYAAKELEDAYRFQILLEYDGSTVFLNRNDDCIITCKVYDNTVDITDEVLAQSGSSFVWSKSLDSTWEPTYVTDTGGEAIPNKILITHEDVERNASFACAVTFDETKFTTEGGASE